MTWFLMLVWCVGYSNAGCNAILIPAPYRSVVTCQTDGQHAVDRQKFQAFKCIERGPE